ncbi:MAG: CrcB family protein [Propionibacteriaceae bacterium]
MITDGPDRPGRSGPNQPVRGTDLLAVVIGGAAGSMARYGSTVLLPTKGGFDWPLLAVNLTGALCLGVLIEVLTRRAPAGRGEPAALRRARLLLGTGFLGGFTTYSALAVGALGPIGAAGVAVLQLVVIVAGGLLAAGAGIAIGVVVGRGRP